MAWLATWQASTEYALSTVSVCQDVTMPAEEFACSSNVFCKVRQTDANISLICSDRR